MVQCKGSEGSKGTKGSQGSLHVPFDASGIIALPFRSVILVLDGEEGRNCSGNPLLLKGGRGIARTGGYIAMRYITLSV